MPEIAKVRTISDVQRMLVSFQEFAKRNPSWAKRLIRASKSTYWLWDEDSQTFGPNKWCGYLFVDPDEYDRAQGGTQGTSANGTNARTAIETIFRESYRRDPSLHEGLHRWAERLTGMPNALRGRMSESEWKFIRLRRSTIGTPAVLSSIQERPVTSAEPSVSQEQTSVLSEELDLDPPEILDPTEMKTIADELDESEYFDPIDHVDARNRVLREIVQRAGQSRFREQLLVAYRSRCAVTGCNLVQVLEAAHIRRYLGEHTNTVRNGLLLRADIHTLFDLNLLGITPNDFTISVAASVAGTSYEKLAGQKLRLPHDDSLKPSVELLRERWEDYGANSGEH